MLNEKGGKGINMSFVIELGGNGLRLTLKESSLEEPYAEQRREIQRYSETLNK
jgi:hypothetical protein